MRNHEAEGDWQCEQQQGGYAGGATPDSPPYTIVPGIDRKCGSEAFFHPAYRYL